MFALIRMIIRIALVMFIGLLVLAFFTNPTREDFALKIKSELDEEIKEQTNNPALQYIAELGLEFSQGIVDKMLERKNYYVCSIFTVHLPDGDYNYLGAYHMFFPLQDINPLDKIRQ